MDLPILTTDEYFNLNKPTDTKTCKGKYYRCHNKKFNSHGTICHYIKFVPLILKSCKGCEQCNSMIDSLPEIDYNYICNNPKDGGTYKLSITNIKVGFDEDYADDWDLEFVLIEE